MAPAIKGWGVALLRLAMHLCAAAYTDDFSAFQGTLLFAHRNSTVGQPAFYVFLLDKDLWIVNRGSATSSDIETCGQFSEVEFDDGVFHSGFYRAAQFTLPLISEFIQSHTGTIYFTGHSYGASVAAVQLVLASSDFFDKDLNAITFAQIPCIDSSTSGVYKNKIALIVVEHDTIPHLSIPNICASLKFLIPKSVEINVNSIVKVAEGFVGPMPVVRSVAEQVMMHLKGERHVIRYPSGQCYFLNWETPTALNSVEFDPAMMMNYASYSEHTLEAHAYKGYLRVVDQLLSE
jgi:hypothetical protein